MIGLNLRLDLATFGFFATGFRFAAVFFLAKGFFSFGKLKTGRLAATFFRRGFAGFFTAVRLTVFLFFGIFTAEYRRSATKRPRLLPELLMSHPIWCLPVFLQPTGFAQKCRGVIAEKVYECDQSGLLAPN